MFICCHHYHDGTGGRALLLAILRRTPFSAPCQWVDHYPRFRSILGDQLDGGEEDKGRKAASQRKEEKEQWWGEQLL